MQTSLILKFSTMVMSHYYYPQLWVLYIFGENMQKSLHLKLPCETRVIFGCHQVFWKKGLL